ncbi:MAG: peptidylprolyl isomerase [Dehalococcoidia bacterium]
MARRERTTALPKQRPRSDARANPGRARLLERNSRWAILGGAAALLLLVLGFFAYQVYDQQIARPNKVIVNVDGQKVRLNYYAERLFSFLQANSNSGVSLALLEEDLVSQLEREEIALILAREKQLDLGNDAVLRHIAEGFGVELGASGSTFDQLYRNQVRTLKVSDSNYRRIKRAELAITLLRAQIKTELGDRGEQITLRSIVLADKAKADELLKRIQSGENFGTVAQQESLDLQSRQQDGLMLPEPVELLPDAISEAVAGKPVGDVVGPVAVQNTWWIFKVERKEPADYSETQKDQLSGVRLNAALDAKREALGTKVDRDFTAEDAEWAEQHAD